MTEAEPLRLVTWQLKILKQAEAADSVARTCRHFGISRKSFLQVEETPCGARRRRPV